MVEVAAPPVTAVSHSLLPPPLHPWLLAGTRGASGPGQIGLIQE